MNTPLQTAAQHLVDRWDSPFWKDQLHTGVYIAELRKALVDEQAQSVEPVAWIGDSPSKGNGRRLFWSESAAYAYADKYEPLYTRPAPPPAGEKKVGPVARVAGVEEYGPRIDWYAHWAELCGANLYATPPPAPPPTTGERAELIAHVKDTAANLEPYQRHRAKGLRAAADMLAAAQGAKP